MKDYFNVKKIDNNFYYLDYPYEYYLDDLLKEGVSNILQLYKFVQKKNKLPIETDVDEDGFACTTFTTQTIDGHHLLCRNFDYKDAPILMVRTKPKNDYQSITFTSLNVMLYGNKHQRIEESNKNRLFLAPYACMDGVNECGLSIAVLELKAKTTRQRENKTNITTTSMIRAVLDKCKDVEEAIQMFSKYNMCSSLFFDYHFHLVDSKGNDVIIEYINNKMNVIRNHKYAMNFYVLDGDNSKEMGRDREAIVKEYLNKNNYSTVNDCFDVLEKCFLNYKHKYGYMIKTLYSCVYDTFNKNVTVCTNRDFNKQYLFSINSNN